jgi:hypothetical protein
MTKLYELDPVHTLFQDEEVPGFYEEVLAKVLNDNFLLMRSEDEKQRFFGALAISHMRDNELAAFRKRITLTLHPPAPIPSLAESRGGGLVARSKAPKPDGFIPAVWTVTNHVDSVGEKRQFLVGKCGKCTQEVRVLEVPAYFEHCGAVEAVPDSAVQQLRHAQGRPVNSTPSDSEIYEQIMRGGQSGGLAAPAPGVVPAPASRPTPALPKVLWHIDSVGGTWRIVGELLGESRWFTGKPKDAANFEFGREKCPANIVAEYTQLLAGVTARQPE